MLKPLLKQKKITQRDLGKQFGLSESAISQYISGKRNVDFETALKFAEFFNCSVDFLYRGDICDMPSSTDNFSNLSDSQIMFALMDGDVDEITDDMYDEVKAFAKFRAEQKRKDKHGT